MKVLTVPGVLTVLVLRVRKGLRVLHAPSALAPLALLALVALAPSAPPAPSAPLALFLLGHRIGSEQYTLTSDALTAHFEYLDRATKIALDTTLTFGKDFTPLSFGSHGRSYRIFPVDTSVPTASGAANTFTLDGMAPISAQGLLIRYWLRHGRPRAIRLEPSGDLVGITELPAWRDTARGRELLQFTVDGVVWGAESVWLDRTDEHVVAAVTNAGVLGFEAADESVSEIGPFVRGAMRERLREAADLKTRTPYVQAGTYALVHGRILDGTGAPAIENGTVIVRNGRIAAVGDAAATPVPSGVRALDISGKTVLPGLWDMHGHVGLAEWGPVYLASGVTTVRDMGGEFDVVTALRDAWRDGRALGPRLLLAGLIDGPGPGSFGHVTAADPAEGRAAVRRYKTAGFEQMKLYSLLDRPTVAAIIDEAHTRGMTVTGHIPNGLTMREVVEMGMDHIAHLGVRGAAGSDEQRETIAFLAAHHTVIDPTLSWNELLGRSAQTPIASFIPRVEHAAPPLRRMLEAANAGDITPQQAHERMLRSLQTVKALHEAGVPIVAGTDKGVPGVSLAREIELYVDAGLSPIDAIRAATAVPARVMGLARDTGTLVPGLRADLIVVDGNPLARIADIEKVSFVSTNGRVYETAVLWRAGGFRE